jgi:hypothetical protein
MNERISPETKPLILETLRYVIESNGRALLEIECDNYGSFVLSSLSGIILKNTHSFSISIAGLLLNDTAVEVSIQVKILSRDMNDLSPRLAIQKLFFYDKSPFHKHR